MERPPHESSIEEVDELLRNLLEELDKYGYLFKLLDDEDKAVWEQLETSAEVGPPELRREALRLLPEFLEHLDRLRLQWN